MQSGYFDILGISKQAGIEEIKKAYRQKAKQLHPDLNNSPDAKEQFVELKKAFEYASRYIEWHKGLHDHVYHTGKNSTTYQSETDFKFSGCKDHTCQDYQYILLHVFICHWYFYYNLSFVHYFT